jgi:tetratricopeptide (TPR) repeat protein
MWRHFFLVVVLAAVPCAWGQSAPKGQSPEPPPNQAPPRSQPTPKTSQPGPGDSSSRDSDWNAGPATADDSVTELHSWDPYKALKDVEVGNFYFKRQNYRAALSRFCEALQYKPNDAVATFRIAESLEKFDDLAGAQAYYESYLKILPEGPFAREAKKALDRIKGQSDRTDKHVAAQYGCEPLGKAVKFRPEPLDPDRPVLSRRPTSPPSGKFQ